MINTDEDVQEIRDEIMKLDREDMNTEELILYKIFQKREETLRQNIKELPKPEPYSICTQSCAATLTHQLYIKELIEKLKTEYETNDSICGIDYDDIILGIEKKARKKRGAASIESKKRFYNQATIVIAIGNRRVNLKFFMNKSISMTGCGKESDGIDAINIILDLCKNKFGESVFIDKDNYQKIRCVDYRVTLINTDYSIPFKINKLDLYKTILENYKLFVDCPEKYPALKINFMWNKNNEKQTGLCTCEKKCEYSKNKRKINDCKIITVAIFQSGKIIITGASDIKQINDTYDYVNDILYENYRNIVGISINDV